jgi:hypothetical protein
MLPFYMAYQSQTKSVVCWQMSVKQANYAEATVRELTGGSTSQLWHAPRLTLS